MPHARRVSDPPLVRSGSSRRRRRRALRLLTALLVGAVFVSCLGRARKPQPTHAELSARYDPPVIALLAGLGPQDVGRVLDGVRVEGEDDPLLQGAEYLGRLPDTPPGVHVHLLRQEEAVLAYLWVDVGGPSWPLPECDPRRAGFRARQLWGQIYTWRAAQAGDGVLVSACPPADWLPAAAP